MKTPILHRPESTRTKKAPKGKTEIPWPSLGLMAPSVQASPSMEEIRRQAIMMSSGGIKCSPPIGRGTKATGKKTPAKRSRKRRSEGTL